MMLVTMLGLEEKLLVQGSQEFPTVIHQKSEWCGNFSLSAAGQVVKSLLCIHHGGRWV
jgi:hypothetical protein